MTEHARTDAPLRELSTAELDAVSGGFKAIYSTPTRNVDGSITWTRRVVWTV